MSETKFTPGPWEWDGNVWDYEYDNEAPWLEGKDGRVVLSGQIRCSTEANAHLIAAAPELYETLEEVIRISDRKHDAWDKAKAALAKARGEK